MSAVSTTTAVRALAESRPPALTWRPGQVMPHLPPDQPPLDLGGADQEVVAQPRPERTSTTVTLVRSRWCARQDRRLPDARTWGVSLAQALVEALSGLRPIAQLNRWVADDVLAEVALHRRRHPAPARAGTMPPVLRSVRLQHPHPEVAELSAHVSQAGRSVAIAFRLEAYGDRWLCTAVELGPRA